MARCRFSRAEENNFWEGFQKSLDKPLVVVLTGAGVSAESGIATFRDSGGLWEKYNVYEVATPEAWQKTPELVLQFYNERRVQLKDVHPNAAHKALAKLEDFYQVVIITQNVDNLHERGGSSKVLHLHGELTKARSVKNEKLIYYVGYETFDIGDVCEEGAQLRPHIVWFGEMVPNIIPAADIVAQADILIVIGTSLIVYPAAGLIEEAPEKAKIFLIDPKPVPLSGPMKKRVRVFQGKASEKTPQLVEQLINEL